MKNSLFIIVLTVLASGCAVYHPQSADIPLISKRNDLRVDAGMAAAFKSGTATISYGITDNFAIQTYGTTDFHDRFFYHGAIGYYKNLDNQKVMEIYLGVGNGSGHVSNHDTDMTTYGDYQQYFVQFNYGKLGLEKSIWDLGLSAKTGYLHSNNLTEFNDNPYSTNTIDRFTFEPGLFTRVGGEHLKLNIKLNGLFIGGPQFNGEADYWPLNLSIGLNYRF